eukprot:6518762-Ditylum_brightwellii.AAC.1
MGDLKSTRWSKSGDTAADWYRGTAVSNSQSGKAEKLEKELKDLKKTVKTLTSEVKGAKSQA